MTIHDEFVKYPTGKIKKGGFCDECKRFNSRYITCDMIAIDNGSVLLVKRGQEPLKGYWAVPGGYLDWEETTEECAARELMEETGYSAREVRLLGVYSRPHRDNEERQNVTICYYSEDIKKTAGFDKNEVKEIRFFPIGKLPEKMAFDHKKIIEDYKKLK